MYGSEYKKISKFTIKVQKNGPDFSTHILSSAIVKEKHITANIYVHTPEWFLI